MLAKAGEGDRVIRTKMVRIPFFIVIGFLIYILTPLAKTSICWQTEGRKDTKTMIVLVLLLSFLFSLRLYSDLIVHVNFFFFLWQYYHSSFIHLSTWGLRTTKKKKPKKSKNRGTIPIHFTTSVKVHHLDRHHRQGYKGR